MNSLIIATNTIKRMLRDLNTLGFIFIFPIIASVLAFVMFGPKAPIDIGVGSQVDKELVSYLNTFEKYNIVEVEKDYEELIDKKVIHVGIKTKVINGEKKIELVAKNSDDKIMLLSNIINGYYQGEIIEDKETSILSKMSIGIFSMFVIMFIGSGMGLLLSDKKEKTILRCYISPNKSYITALGYLLANIVLGALQIIIFLLVTTLIFKVVWATSIINVFLVLFIYLVACLGLGVGLIGFIKSAEQYNVVISILAIVTSFIGGSFIPLDILNNLIKKIANFVPQKWLIESYDKLSQGMGIWDIRLNLIILIFFAILMFTFGVKNLKPISDD